LEKLILALLPLLLLLLEVLVSTLMLRVGRFCLAFLFFEDFDLLLEASYSRHVPYRL